MSSYNSLIESIKSEMAQQGGNAPLQKEAGLLGSNQGQVDDTGMLSDLNIDLVPQQVVHEASASIEKVAEHLEKTSSLEELVKVAEESGNQDIGNLVKLADAIADRITEKVLSNLSQWR